MFSKWASIVVFCFSYVFAAEARNLFELESQYHGNGVFEYRLRTLHDPFITGITIHQILPSPFTNFVECTPPEHWTNYFSQYDSDPNAWAGIMFDDSVTQPRTNEIIFAPRSSSSDFKLKQYGMTLIVYFQLAAEYDGFNGLGGYVTLDCLTPCSPEESDGSPSQLTSYREAVKDIKIDALVRTNQAVHGITFSWNQPSTVELEGSHNLKDWNYIARFFGNAPQTTWTTNLSLNSYGRFFRLALVANKHLTNDIAPDAASFVGRQTLVPVENCRIRDGRFIADFISNPEAVYRVEFCNTKNQIVEMLQLVATNSTTTVSFDVKDCPDGGFVRVSR